MTYGSEEPKRELRARTTGARPVESSDASELDSPKKDEKND